MEILSYEKLDNVRGGGKGIWFVLGGIFTFLAGVFAGFTQTESKVCGE